MSEAVRPLRVLHVITRMIVGGAQENTLLSCALADRARFRSEIVCGEETGAEGSLLEECRARGVPVRIEPMLVRRVSPFTDLAATFRLVRLLRRERWDVVHVHTSKAGIVGRVAAWLAGVPVVIHTAHGWAFSRDERGAGRAMWIALEWLCAKLSHAIVVVASPDRDEALRLGIGRPEQYRLIRSGIEIEAYRDAPDDPREVRASLALPADAFVVGTVGRLSRQKAPLDLLAAFARIAPDVPHAHLVFVGDGPLRAELEAAIRERGLEPRVHLLGLRRDVPRLLRALDVFALSSRWEGLPRVFPQAMAAGLPIVATRVQGAEEVVNEGENGRLVDVGDVETLARRLRELADDPARAKAMGAAGARRVEEFSATTMVRALERLYEELAARRGVRRGASPAH